MIKNIALFITTTILLVLGQALWKIASTQVSEIVGAFNVMLNLARNLYFLSGCVFYVVATGLWIYLLGQYDYSRIYPIFVGTCIIFSLIVGVLLFRETSGGIYKILGSLFIVCGIIIIANS